MSSTSMSRCRDTTVAVVTDSDGEPIQVGAGSAAVPTARPCDRHLVESGPDPDGPGVAVHAIDDEESEPEVLAEEPVPAHQGEGQGLAGESARVPRSATQLRPKTAKSGRPRRRAS